MASSEFLLFLPIATKFSSFLQDMLKGIGTLVSPTAGRSPTDIVKNIHFECTYHFWLKLNGKGALPILAVILPEGGVSNYTTTTNTTRKQPSCNSAAS
ncbi:hypothetical protein K443DRAFT_3524 [Laccaria amethystina LaAM-08-1]|uniref:Uncharacterized protein n=1 Tax=Laccaria amethystina LaAM-08-1 TaxID=1095629 RepID=A0A0C9Y738_9AGAR|nr:hypothetical protein K443DRAFT_3524 [Laccaria amethystina LaAM-08-1]